MNKRAHKCLFCRKAYQATKRSQKYCSGACRQAAYRRRKRKEPPPKRKEQQALFVRVCDHCGGSFWAKMARARFCSTSCRTLYHRALKAALPQALVEAFGLPKDKAEDIVETQAVTALTQVLRNIGYAYHHSGRRWLAIPNNPSR